MPDRRPPPFETFETADVRPLVVICAATYWSGVTMLDHHLARGLTRYADVIYVDRPSSVLTRFRHPAAAKAAAGAPVERVAPGLTVVRPRVNPSMESRWGKPLALALIRRTMRRAVRRYGGGRPVQAVIVPTLDPLLGVLGERVRVFYASDDLVAGAALMGVSESALRARAERRPKEADVVVAVSDSLVEALRQRGIAAELIPNGVDVEHFATTGPTRPTGPTGTTGPPAGIELPATRTGQVVGFVGHLGDRIDLQFLEAVLDRGHGLLLIGPVQRTATAGRLQRLLARPDVAWVGARPYAELPALLAAADTWLLPYGDSAFNRASFPLKVLEYLAAGRRVVSTALPAIDWLGTDLIVTANDPQGFADAVDRSVATRPSEAERAARTAFAAGHDWSARVRTLAGLIGLVETSSSAPLSASGAGQERYR